MKPDANVGVVGASGYTGLELLRLLERHPSMRLSRATADTKAGMLASLATPSLAVAHRDLVLEEFEPRALHGLDAVFLCLPHEKALEVVPELLGRVGVVVDLSGAFRLRDASAYDKWYGFAHTAPELLGRARYGLPELKRSELVGADLVAVPGCYVTAATLALAPLVAGGLIDARQVIVDAISGTSGAGRAARQDQIFAEVDGGVAVYGLLDHRHTPEMEQEIGAQVLFTPHLAPMTRGILATCYAHPAASNVSTERLLACLAHAYQDERFISVRPQTSSTKATLGSNSVHLTARFDERTGFVVVVAILDNLVKGAAGAAVQSANVALGLPEGDGLTTIGLWP